MPGDGPGFLMSPRLNDSSTFSQCSRNQMAPVVAESSCIRTRQYVDLALEMPVTDYAGHTRIPETIQFDVVNTGTRTAEGTTASVDLDHSLTPTSISAEGGSCTVESGDIGCQLGNIPAGARRRVRFDVTAIGPGSTSSSITVAIDGDVDQGNNQGAFVLIVAALGNASVAMSPASRTVRVGETFESPGITVRALEQTEAVRVRIIVPPELIIEGVAQHAGPCSISNGTVDCDFGDMQFADQRDIFMSLRATQAGSFTIAAEVMPLDDSDPSDNSATVTIDVDPAAQPPRQEPPTSSGGGGGAIDWTCLLLGAPGVGLRRRRRPAAVVHPRQVHSGRCPMDLHIDGRRAGDALERERRRVRGRSHPVPRGLCGGAGGRFRFDGDRRRRAARVSALPVSAGRATRERTSAQTRRSPSSSTSTARRHTSRSLRGAWLADLGTRRQWQTYLEHYEDDADTNVTLRCHALAARAALDRDEGLEEAIAEQWLTAAQPSRCLRTRPSTGCDRASA